MPVYSQPPMSPESRLNVDEFLLLSNADWHHELIDGIVVNSPLPSTDHQRLLFRLARQIELAADGGEVLIAPTGVYLDASNLLVPDILWIAPNSRRLSDTHKVLRGIPDLVVEVLLPATAYRDRGIKFKKYEQMGVGEYWIADPLVQYIEAYRLDPATHRYFTPGVYREADMLPSPRLDGVVNLINVFTRPDYSSKDDTRPSR